MSSPCRFLFRSLVFAVLMTGFFSASHAPDAFGQDTKQQQDEADSARSDLPFRVYAEWAIDSFDANKDGSLTKAEMKEMRSPLLEEWYDQDKNGKLSFSEIVEAIRRPSSAKVKEDAEVRAKPKLDVKHVKYAAAIIKQYDLDNDNYLSLGESKTMRRPVARSVDKNQDGKFSLHEIATSLAETTSQKTSSPQQVIVVKKDLKPEAEMLAEIFLEASIKKNDKNGDGKLDSKEITSADWSTIRWQDSDTDKDGQLSRDELKVRYRDMFNKLLDQRSAVKSLQMKMRQADQSRSSSNKKDINLLSGLLGGSSGDVLGNIGHLGQTSARSKPTKKTTYANRFVDVEIYLLRLPQNSDSSRLATAVKTLRASNEKTADAVTSLAKQLGIAKYDQLVLSSQNRRKASIRSAASVPMFQGATQTARGRTLNTAHVDVGLNVELTPELTEGVIFLELEIAKSDLLVTEKGDQEIPDSRVIEWTFDSVVQIEPGSPAIIGSSSSNQQWILVADAEIEE